MIFSLFDVNRPVLWFCQACYRRPKSDRLLAFGQSASTTALLLVCDRREGKPRQQKNGWLQVYLSVLPIVFIIVSMRA